MTPESGQTIGPFVLAEIVGIGGMGEVWRAHHHRSGTAVAVKVITSDRAAEPRYRQSFMREVQAVAGLNHPGVVAIYEFGEIVDGRTSVPWYAMEIAETSLAEVQIGDWRTLQRVLVEMLDALAHAHARGIIHRDLKPENVLIADDYSVKLTDFGMAHVTEEAHDTANIFGPGGGTPDFMAPEQFRGQWRKFGPWTDLYAIGCVAWELATGMPPFVADSSIEMAMAHMNNEPPELAPLYDVPPRLGVWLKRLIQKHPLDRYRRAADALWALVHDVGADYDDQRETRPRGRPGVPKGIDEADTRDHGRKRDTLDDVVSTMQVSYGLTPPFPSTWRTDHKPIRLGGAGLGLFGIREIPFVGREGAREYLWDRLREVDETSQNELILVYGDPGIGRTRFGTWVSRRADELGAATVVRAAHGPIPSRTDGLAGAVMRFLGIEGVDAARASDIVGDRLGPTFDPTLLFELLYPRKSDDTFGTSNYASPSQRYAAIERLLKQLSWERSVIFFVDDVQWGADTLLFVQHLMTRKTRTLIVANVRNDELLKRYWESQLLSEVELSPNASTIHLQPLRAEEQLELMDAMLDLETELAQRVVERTQGIPLFATQLVGDWVQRGMLEEGDDGFRLQKGARIELPDDVYDLWNDRIDELSATLESADVRAVLEAAALLGKGDSEELHEVCEQLGLVIPPDFEHHLVARRLATPEVSGWSFQHGMLRETLERSAVESGRADRIYRAAGDIADATTDPYRVAEFYVRAGELEHAITNLLAAIDVGMLTMGIDQSLQVVEMIDELLDEVGAAPGDPRRGRAFAASVEILRLSGDVPRAMARATELVELAEEYGWGREAGYGHVHLGVLSEITSAERSVILHHFDDALALFDEEDDDAGRAHAYRALARYHLGVGNPAVASNLILKAHDIVERLEDTDGIIECLVALGKARLAEDDMGAARDSFERAARAAEKYQLRLLLAEALDGLGQVAQEEGDLDSARANYSRAQALWLATGSQNAHIAGVHLALLLLEQEDYEPAQLALLETHQLVVAGTLPQVGQIVDAGLMVCAAVAGDEEMFDTLNRELRALLRQTPAPDMKVPEVTFLAGRKWAEAGDRARARKAYDVARNVFLAIGEQQSADEVAFAIGRL